MLYYAVYLHDTIVSKTNRKGAKVMDMQYMPQAYAKADFNTFWEETRACSDAQPLSPVFTPVPFCDEIVCAQRVYFSGFGGGRLEGLLLQPKKSPSPNPAILFTHGYSVSIQPISYYLKWILAGFTVLAVNMRVEIPMRNADTPSCRVPGGIMLRGFEKPETYIYRYMYTDVYRAVQLLRSVDGVDANRVGIWGASQGAAVAVAAAALDGNISFLSLLYPFMNCIEDAIAKKSEGPYQEFWRYFRLYDSQLSTLPDLCKTLSYFDILHFADKIQCPTLVGAGLTDKICLPQNTIGFYNTLQCDKRLELYHTHGHEDIPAFEDASYLFCMEKAGL